MMKQQLLFLALVAAPLASRADMISLSCGKLNEQGNDYAVGLGGEFPSLEDGGLVVNGKSRAISKIKAVRDPHNRHNIIGYLVTEKPSARGTTTEYDFQVGSCQDSEELTSLKISKMSGTSKTLVQQYNDCVCDID